VPVFGRYAASQWLWVLDPSLAYVGQGAIMGPATSLHVFCGAVLAWGVLSPLASHKGWAAGSIDDVEHGPKGWLMWIALAVLLAETTLSLGWLLIGLFANAIQSIRHLIAKSSTTEASQADKGHGPVETRNLSWVARKRSYYHNHQIQCGEHDSDENKQNSVR
jgi:uncharacterized oligopeptide transporter (OPT) family protein